MEATAWEWPGGSQQPDSTIKMRRRAVRYLSSFQAMLVLTLSLSARTLSLIAANYPDVSLSRYTHARTPVESLLAIARPRLFA